MSEETKTAFKAGKVKCSKCGELKFVNATALAARIKKFGSIEKIEAEWVCSKCQPEKPVKVKRTKKVEVIKQAEEAPKETTVTDDTELPEPTLVAEDSIPPIGVDY